MNPCPTPAPSPTAVVQFPCVSPPFSRPVGNLTAQPTLWPRYVIPCSHLLDPAYATSLNATYPFPRMPRAFESETRADGTGLIWGASGVPGAPTQPCPPQGSFPCPSQPSSSVWCGIWQPWNPALANPGVC